MDSSCSTPSSSRAAPTARQPGTRLPHHLQQPSSSSFSDPEVFTSPHNIRQGQSFVSVQTLTKESFFIAVNQKTKVHDVLWKCGERLEIAEDKLFGLAIRQAAEGIGGDQPRHEYYFLDPAAKIMKYAHKQSRFSQWHNKSSENRPVLVLYFRVRVYIEQVGLLTCPKALEHYYLQLKDNFLDHWSGRNAVSEERCWEMAALALKADKGDDHQGYFRAEQYFPLWVINERGLEYIRNNMPAACDDLRAMKQQEAMTKFAVEASRSPFALNCHLYGLRRHKMDSVDNAVLAINAKGIEMCDISEHGDRIPLRSLLWNRVTRLSFDRKKLTIVGSDGTKMSLYAQTESKARYLLELCRAVHQTLLVMSHLYARMPPLPQPYQEKSVDRLSTSTTTSGIGSGDQDKDSDSLSSACDRGHGSISSKLRLRIKMDSNLDVKIEKMELDNIRQERAASQSSKASDESARSRPELRKNTMNNSSLDAHPLTNSQLPSIDTGRPSSVDSASQTVESGSRSAPIDVNFNTKFGRAEELYGVSSYLHEMPYTACGGSRGESVQQSSEIEQGSSTASDDVELTRRSVPIQSISMHDLRTTGLKKPPSYDEPAVNQRSYSPPSTQMLMHVASMATDRMPTSMTRSEPEIDGELWSRPPLDQHAGASNVGRFVKKNSAGSRASNAINRVHSMPSHYHVNVYRPQAVDDHYHAASSLHHAHSLHVPSRPKNPPPYEHPPAASVQMPSLMSTGPLPAEAAGGQPSFPPASATPTQFSQVLRDEEGLSTERLRNFPLLHHLWKESHGLATPLPPSNGGIYQSNGLLTHHRRPSSCIDLTSDSIGAAVTVLPPSNVHRADYFLDSAQQNFLSVKSSTYGRTAVESHNGLHFLPPPPPYPQQMYFPLFTTTLVKVLLICVLCTSSIMIVASVVGFSVFVLGIYSWPDQSVAVRGILMCGDQPAEKVRVKLWDEDTGPDPDDLLDQGYSTANGSFYLQGWTSETTPIDPVLKIYHDCNDEITPTHRKVKFTLPDKYITSGKVPNVTMNVGIIQLELEFKKEEREVFID
ncbi:unnamed protein product [Caenorhabditis auriculariae]|uniref:FERM domain-containing protein n=1 Tax=Caenorhabditis auriculariae TaxID=2777116 RepID=A0A8S1H197_9PELO|nr:unnamed protein product [Caenorhabditis auriculariae]